MREDWEHPAEALNLSVGQLATLLRPAFPGGRITEAQKATGGLANVTYAVRLAGREQPVGVRLYVREPGTAAREQAVCRLVATKVPVPQVLWAAPDNAVTGHPYAITEWLPGERLDAALGRAVESRAGAALGRAVGAALAGIASCTFPATGFLAEDLRVADPLDLGGAGYQSLVTAWLEDPLVRDRLGGTLCKRIAVYAGEERAVMDELRALPPCLVHGDFDATNILIEVVGGAYRVSGVLDWEFALSGSVVMDIGHALRPPEGKTPGFAGGLLAGFTDAGGRLPPAWRRSALASDLLAWLSFAKRRDAGPALLRSVRQMIEGILTAP